MVYTPSEFDGTLGELAERVTELISVYGADAILCYDKYHSDPYDDRSCPVFFLNKPRLETDEEYNSRIEIEKIQAINIEKRERAQLEELKKKYR